MKTKLLRKIRKRFIVYKLDGMYVYLDRRNDYMSNKFKTLYSLICDMLYTEGYLMLVRRNQGKRYHASMRIQFKKAVPLCKK